MHLRFDRGDTVKMKVDFSQRSIAYAINDAAFKKFGTIAVSSNPYYLVVVISTAGDQIELTNCSLPNDEEEKNQNMKDNQVLSLSIVLFLQYIF